jgi:hypothetical protein
MVMKLVVASVAREKLGTLNYDCQTGIIFRLTLVETGHTQPRTPVCNNATAVGVAHNLIKRQCLHSMEMLFFWVGDKIAQHMYDLSWHPRQEILADYQRKHHLGSHHANVRPWYLHMEN